MARFLVAVASYSSVTFRDTCLCLNLGTSSYYDNERLHYSHFFIFFFFHSIDRIFFEHIWSLSLS